MQWLAVSSSNQTMVQKFHSIILVHLTLTIQVGSLIMFLNSSTTLLSVYNSTSGKSLFYNLSGANTEPCGTPLLPIHLNV